MTIYIEKGWAKLYLAIPLDLHKQLKKEAMKENRSITNMLQSILIERYRK